MKGNTAALPARITRTGVFAAAAEFFSASRAPE